MKSWVAIALLGGTLAGCGGGGTPAGGGNITSVNGTASGPLPPPAPGARDPVEDKINALDEVGQKITFFRAILDADFKCKKIVRIDKKPRDGDRPVWLITCDDNGEYTITLQPRGVFNVSGVPQTRMRFPKATATAAPMPPPR